MTLAKSDVEVLSHRASIRQSLRPTVPGVVADRIVFMDGTQQLTASLPTPVLVRVFYNAVKFSGWEHLNGPNSLRDLARVIRARPDVRLYGYLLAICNRYDPPNCACGKPGLYIVGSRCFCRQHKPGVGDPGLAYRRALLERKGQAIDDALDARDQVLRSVASAKRTGKFGKGGRRP